MKKTITTITIILAIVLFSHSVVAPAGGSIGQQTGDISGRIYATDFSGLCEALLTLDMGAGGYIYSHTDYGGYYYIPSIPVGSGFALCASKPGYITTCMTGIQVWGGENTEVAFNVQHQPGHTGFHLSGRITAASTGAGLGGVKVDLYDYWKRHYGPYYADSNGYYFADNIPSYSDVGAYTVKFSKANYATKEVPFAVHVCSRDLNVSLIYIGMGQVGLLSIDGKYGFPIDLYVIFYGMESKGVQSEEDGCVKASMLPSTYTASFGWPVHFYQQPADVDNIVVNNGQLIKVWNYLYAYEDLDFDGFASLPILENPFRLVGSPDCNDANPYVYGAYGGLFPPSSYLINPNPYCNCTGAVSQGQPEICDDGIDNDCDGLIDLQYPNYDPDCLSNELAMDLVDMKYPEYDLSIR